MNFCENCNFMLYKKLQGSDDCKGIPENSKVCHLIEYCKNCGYEKPVVEDNTSVYKRTYQSNFAIDNIVKNKYIVYDNTLPRLLIDCKNKNCITSEHYNYLNYTNSIIVGNIPENITNADIKDLLTGFSTDSMTETLQDRDYVQTINGFRMHFKRIRLCEIIVYYTHENISDESNIELLQTINTSFKEYIETFDVKEKFGQTEKLYLENYKKYNKEVLYVKYDPQNMKYLYMCVNCGTSW